jgi:hypothetical protein
VTAVGILALFLIKEKLSGFTIKYVASGELFICNTFRRKHTGKSLWYLVE